MAQTKQRAGAKSKPSAKKARPKTSRPTKAAATNGASRPKNGSKQVTDKVKVPLLAGGAALVGAAGGLAMGARHGRRGRRLTDALPQRPQIKVDSHDIAKAAKEVGNFGAQVGHLASELQRARESANGGKRRSPVEVVLQGLTHRGSSG